MTPPTDPSHVDARASMGRVVIVDYDPHWPRDFETERDALRAQPGSPLIELEHFGSTAVKGLRAKPVIDIIASVASLADADDFASKWAGHGYKLIDVGFRKRRFFHKAPGERGVGFHLHVVTQAAWTNKNERLLRDWLIGHQEVAQAYGRLKDELALRFADDRAAYTEAKSDFLRAAINDARRSAGLEPESHWWDELVLPAARSRSALVGCFSMCRRIGAVWNIPPLAIWLLQFAEENSTRKRIQHHPHFFKRAGLHHDREICRALCEERLTSGLAENWVTIDG